MTARKDSANNPGYEPPQLRRHGELAEITQTWTEAGSDLGNRSARPMAEEGLEDIDPEKKDV